MVVYANVFLGYDISVEDRGMLPPFSECTCRVARSGLGVADWSCGLELLRYLCNQKKNSTFAQANVVSGTDL